jgi:hypothetical protein
VNWHPTEEELVLHYYGESPAGDRSRVDEHLGACARCRDAWQELTGMLSLVRSAEVPEPDQSFERVMWARIRPELQPRPSGWLAHKWAVAGAMAAGLVAAVAGGYTWIRLQPAVPDVGSTQETIAATAGGNARERVLLTALTDHFSQTELLLVELLNSPAEVSVLEFERITADDLVTSGRLYRQTARQNGDVQFAQLLDDLEGVLVEVARGPEQVDRQDFESLRARIDDDGLLFKVRAVTTEVRDRQHTLMTLQ